MSDDAGPLGITGGSVTASCYHHQAIDRVGDGLTVVGTSGDGVVEAVVADTKAWTVGVQWHPEDTYAQDAQQRELMGALVLAAGRN